MIIAQFGICYRLVGWGILCVIHVKMKIAVEPMFFEEGSTGALVLWFSVFATESSCFIVMERASDVHIPIIRNIFSVADVCCFEGVSVSDDDTYLKSVNKFGGSGASLGNNTKFASPPDPKNRVPKPRTYASKSLDSSITKLKKTAQNGVQPVNTPSEKFKRDDSVDTLEWVKRFYLQSVSADLLWKERVAWCCRRPVPGVQAIRVMRHKLKKRATVQNTCRCMSVWSCPVCSAIVTEQRRREMHLMLAHQVRYDFLFVTFTLRHQLKQGLGDVVDMLAGAYRSFHSGAPYQRIKERYSVVGSVRALEVTHGSNGWHPHIHQLLVVDGKLLGSELKELTNKMKLRWLSQLDRAGGNGLYDVALDVKRSWDSVADYVAKYGRLPLNGTKWGVAEEMTKQPVKVAHTLEGRSPFQLLEDCLHGDIQSGMLFKEYAGVMKGKQQLVWSEGLKARFGLDDLTDEAVIEADSISSDYEHFVDVPLRLWRKVLRYGGREAFIHYASVSAGVEGFSSWLRWVDKNYPD